MLEFQESGVQFQARTLSGTVDGVSLNGALEIASAMQSKLMGSAGERFEFHSPFVFVQKPEERSCALSLNSCRDLTGGRSRQTFQDGLIQFSDCPLGKLTL